MKPLTALTFAGCAVLSAAQAGDPFSDVPAGDWAYQGAAQLGRAGIVDGYQNGVFRGGRILTRYEFALLAGNAQTKVAGADAENQAVIARLAAEFEPELKALKMSCARPSKGNFADSIAVSGDTRLRFNGDSPKVPGNVSLSGADQYDLRSRVNFKANINDKADVWFRIMAQATAGTQGFSVYGSHNIGSGSYTGGNSNNPVGNAPNPYIINADVAQLTFHDTFGLDWIRLGRSAMDSIGYGFMSRPGLTDGVWISKGFGKFNFNAFTGMANDKDKIAIVKDGSQDVNASNQVTTFQATYKFLPNFTGNIAYYNAAYGTNGANYGAPPAAGWGYLTTTSTMGYRKSSGYDLSFDGNVGPVRFLGEFFDTKLREAHGGLPSNPKGWYLQLDNGTGPKAIFDIVDIVDYRKPHTDAFSVSYHVCDAGVIPYNAGGFDVMPQSYPGELFSAINHCNDNAKGWLLAYENVIFKNVVLDLELNFENFKNMNLLPSQITNGRMDTCYKVALMVWY
ncbi:MAG: S-layer homology domain-containing protein [Holophaga sp.]|nr:S-layer homology domain-containing protein [Holophaga sp.]